MPDTPETHLTLRQADQARTDFAIIEDELEALHADRNFTRAKVERRREQLEQSVSRYLSQLDTADRQQPFEALATKTTRPNEKLGKLHRRCGASTGSRRECSLRPIGRSR